MKNALLFIVLLSFYLVTGCATGNKFSKQHNPESIPKDIRNNGYVLLVRKYDGGMMSGRNNRAMEKFLSKHYGAPFELVSKDELNSAKYADVNKYRYYIKDGVNGLTVKEGTGPGMDVSRSYNDLVIFDRKENKSLPSTGVLAPSFAAGIKMFAEYMGKH